MTRHTRLGLTLAAIYLIPCIGAVGFLVYLQVFEPAASEFSSLPLIIVGLPWSLLALEALDWLGVPGSRGIAPPTFALVLCVALNAGILFGLGWGLGRAVDVAPQGRPDAAHDEGNPA